MPVFNHLLHRYRFLAVASTGFWARGRTPKMETHMGRKELNTKAILEFYTDYLAQAILEFYTDYLALVITPPTKAKRIFPCKFILLLDGAMLQNIHYEHGWGAALETLDSWGEKGVIGFTNPNGTASGLTLELLVS